MASKYVLDGARKRELLESVAEFWNGRKRSENCRYAVRGTFASLDIDVDDIPVLARRPAKFQHQAGLAYPPGREHQYVLALRQMLPETGQLVLASVEVVAHDGLPGDVPHLCSSDGESGEVRG